MAKDAKKKVVKKIAKAAPKPVAKPVSNALVKGSSKMAKVEVKNPLKKPLKKPIEAKVKAEAKPKVVVTKTKVAAKPEVKVIVKAVAKIVAKPVIKPVTKPVTKPVAKVEPKVEAKSVGGKKGITVVEPPKFVPKKPKPKSTTLDELPNLAGELLRPGGPSRKPLIPSGPKAPTTTPLGSHALVADVELPPAKTPFNKSELKHYKDILLVKRAELIGDVASMEKQALEGGSGSSSHQPQHIAEQGSDSYDQTLALEIAAQDRRLVKEIDDALNRIDAGTYGICELSGKAISKHRLEELPWARFSIEAAREQERRSMRTSYASRHDQ